MREANDGTRERHAFNKLTRHATLISVHDFEQAHSAATFLIEDVDESAKYSLAEKRRFGCYETAMVIAYARPFSTAKGEVGKLRWKDTGLSLTVAEKSLHGKLIKHRNTVYGRSDAEFVEMRVMVMHLFDNNGFDSKYVMPRFEDHMRFSLAEVNAIREILLRLVHALFHECQKLGAEFKDRFTTHELNIGK